MIIKTKLIDGGKMPEYKTAGGHDFLEVDELSETERGENGFGSTGTN